MEGYAGVKELYHFNFSQLFGLLVQKLVGSQRLDLGQNVVWWTGTEPRLLVLVKTAPWNILYVYSFATWNDIRFFCSRTGSWRESHLGPVKAPSSEKTWGSFAFLTIAWAFIINITLWNDSLVFDEWFHLMDQYGHIHNVSQLCQLVFTWDKHETNFERQQEFTSFVLFPREKNNG